MERLNQSTKKGLSKQQILFWGMLFLLAGMFGRSVLQIRVLQIGTITSKQ